MITESTLNNSHRATNKLENSILSHQTIMRTLNIVCIKCARLNTTHRKEDLYKFRIFFCFCMCARWSASFSFSRARCYQNLLYFRIFFYSLPQFSGYKNALLCQLFILPFRFLSFFPSFSHSVFF